MIFSDKELQIIRDTEFLKTKILVIEKLSAHFEKVREYQKRILQNSSFSFSPKVDITNGKIFKGENYKSLPYLVLDYPKLYSKNDTFSFRTMFLWGNFYSSTLHLKGKSFENYRDRISNNLSQFIENRNDIYICVNESEWEYLYDNENYVIINKENIDIIKNVKFLKISMKFNLDDYNELPLFASSFLNHCLLLLE